MTLHIMMNTNWTKYIYITNPLKFPARSVHIEYRTTKGSSWKMVGPLTLTSTIRLSRMVFGWGSYGMETARRRIATPYDTQLHQHQQPMEASGTGEERLTVSEWHQAFCCSLYHMRT